MVASITVLLIFIAEVASQEDQIKPIKAKTTWIQLLDHNLIKAWLFPKCGLHFSPIKAMICFIFVRGTVKMPKPALLTQISWSARITVQKNLSDWLV